MTAGPIRPRKPDGNRAPLQALAHETARRLDLDPFDEPVVLDLAAVAIARLAWRDSPLEDWHAAPNNRISNAELMRATASITRHIREFLGVDHRSPLAPTAGAAADIRPAMGVRAPARRMVGAWVAFDALAAALTAPDRPLPDGRRLHELAPTPEQLAAYGDHVRGLGRQWDALAAQASPATVLLLLADYAGVSCRRWWLGLDWPYLVTEFVARLEDPSRWGSPAMVAHVRHLTPPSRAANLDDLRALLLAGPDRMDAETADYCLRAGLGGLLPDDYHRSPRPRHSLLDTVLPLIAPKTSGCHGGPAGVLFQTDILD